MQASAQRVGIRWIDLLGCNTKQERTMGAKALAIKALRDEVDRLANGGDLDKVNATRLLTMATLQLEDWQQAYYEAWEDRLKFAKQCTTNGELLAALGMLLDVGQRVVKGEIDKYSPIEFARDVAPFKNLMATIYGLDPVGGELPVRKLRKKTRQKIEQVANAT
jgi:hypothetical protein